MFFDDSLDVERTVYSITRRTLIQMQGNLLTKSLQAVT